MKHELVVGGTSMQEDVSLWLLKNGYYVLTIKRTPNQIKPWEQLP